VKTLLRALGAADAAAGRTEEARRIIGYLLTTPEKDHALPTELSILFYRAREKGQPIERAASPFNEAPTPRPRAAPAPRRPSPSR